MSCVRTVFSLNQILTREEAESVGHTCFYPFNERQIELPDLHNRQAGNGATMTPSNSKKRDPYCTLPLGYSKAAIQRKSCTQTLRTIQEIPTLNCYIIDHSG